jgi:hypothetical protein
MDLFQRGSVTDTRNTTSVCDASTDGNTVTGNPHTYTPRAKAERTTRKDERTHHLHGTMDLSFDDLREAFCVSPHARVRTLLL